jgi:hypothetical protein
MTEQKKQYVEIDASAWLNKDGVEVSVFIGDDASEACTTNVQSYEMLVEQSIGCHCTHGRLTNKFGYDNIGEAEDIVIALEEAATLARELFESLKDE